MLLSESVAQFVTDRLQRKSKITEDQRATQGRHAACLHHTVLADSHSARLVKQQVPRWRAQPKFVPTILKRPPRRELPVLGRASSLESRNALGQRSAGQSFSIHSAEPRQRRPSSRCPSEAKSRPASRPEQSNLLMPCIKHDAAQSQVPEYSRAKAGKRCIR